MDTTIQGGGSSDDSYPKVEVPSEIRTRDEAIRFLVLEVEKLGQFPGEQFEQIVASIIRREELGSTGIGRGVAVPHTHWPMIKKSSIVVGRLAVPIDWQSLDGRPVRYACIAIFPAGQHEEAMRQLKRLSRYLNSGGHI